MTVSSAQRIFEIGNNFPCLQRDKSWDQISMLEYE